MLNNNLKLAMLELSDLNRAVLEFYFDSSGKDHYTVVDTVDQADAYIIDYDYPGAKEYIAELHSTTAKPALVISIEKQDIPFSVWLKKPLSAQELTKATIKIKEILREINTTAKKNKTDKKEYKQEITKENSELELAVAASAQVATTSNENIRKSVISKSSSKEDEEINALLDSLFLEKDTETNDIDKTTDSPDEVSNLTFDELSLANTTNNEFQVDNEKDSEETSNNDALNKTKELSLELEEDPTVEESAEKELNVDSETSTTSNSNLDSLLEEVAGETDVMITDVIENQNQAERIDSELITPVVNQDNSSTLFNDQELESVNDDILTEDPTDKDLQSLLNEVRQEATKYSTDSDSEPSEANAKKRWVQLCGVHANIQNSKEAKSMSFKVENHLLNVVQNQIGLSRGTEQFMRLKYNNLIIVLDHLKNRIYCNLPLDSDEYSEICYKELDPKDVKIHDLDYSEVRSYEKKFKENAAKAHLIESFIWTTSLLTSKGRLPAGTDINKKIGLKTWPNLTRSELIPHAINIAAVLSKHPGSLLEVSNWLEIDQKYVFAFYNAALSLGMIEHNTRNLKFSTFSSDKTGVSENSTKRGFLGGLIKRLKS